MRRLPRRSPSSAHAWLVDDLRRPISHLALIAAMTFAFNGSGMAAAQQTVIIGGSGKNPVEVNMGVLDALSAPRLRKRIVLEPPGQAPRSAFLLNSASAGAATSLVKPLIAPAAPPVLAPDPKPAMAAEPVPAVPVTSTESLAEIATPMPSVTLPEPETLQAMPLTPVTSVPAPEPAPSTTATIALPPPEPEPVAAPEPVPEPVAVAALSPEPAAAPGDTLSIPFVGDSSELPGGADQDLQAVADKLAANDNLRAQVKAYAGGVAGGASTARRLSLSRALAVRSVLIELGVRSTRIDVRALGDRNEGGAPDRVDVLVINR